jgi:hypothetical protein
MEVNMKRYSLSSMSTWPRSLICAAVLAVAALGAIGTAAHASDCPPAYRYEWVLCYEYRQVPYEACETRYDHCGRAYQVNVTRYRSEQVPVWRRVAVRNY